MKNLKVFTMKATVFGTTFSGHPTCTTCGGTLRNLLYNFFALERRINNFSFFLKYQSLPDKSYKTVDGAYYIAKDPRFVIDLIRHFVFLFVAGDDTARLARYKEDQEAWNNAIN